MVAAVNTIHALQHTHLSLTSIVTSTRCDCNDKYAIGVAVALAVNSVAVSAPCTDHDPEKTKVGEPPARPAQ